MRKVVGARELKTRLGTYLRAVRSGTVIVVTERGRPVAELRSIAERPGDAEVLDDLAARGWISKASGEALSSFTPVRVAGRPVSTTIVEQREDRF